MQRLAAGSWHSALKSARSCLSGQRAAGTGSSQLLIAPTQSVKAWRSMLDAQWPHTDSQVNVLSPSSLSLLYLSASKDSGAAAWGSALASACLRQSHPGDIPPNLLSQQKARKLLAQQIHEFPQSPFIPPADSQRFVNTLHRAFSALVEQGFVPLGPGTHEKPHHIPEHTWQLYSSWWNIKERVGVLEFADVTAIALSTWESGTQNKHDTQIQEPGTTTPLGELQAALFDAVGAHSPPVVADPHSMSASEQRLLHGVGQKIGNLSIIDTQLGAPTRWGKQVWQTTSLSGAAKAQVDDVPVQAAARQAPTSQLDVHAQARATHLMDNGLFVSPRDAPRTAALWCADRRAQFRAVMAAAEQLGEACPGSANAVLCRSIDDANVMVESLSSELHGLGVKVVPLFPRSLAENEAVALTVAALQLAFTPEPVQAACRLLEFFGLTPLEARNVATAVTGVANEGHLPWTLAAQRAAFDSAFPAGQLQRVQDAMSSLTDLLVSVAGLPAATTAFRAHEVLVPGVQPGPAAEELFSIVQSMDATEGGRAKSTDWAKAADTLHALVRSLPQRNDTLDSFLAEHHRPPLDSDPTTGPPEARLFVGTTRSALSVGIDFDNVLYMDASARHLPGSQPLFPLGTAPVAEASDAAYGQTVERPLGDPLSWNERQGMFLDSLRALCSGSLVFMCPAYSAAGLSELHGVGDDMSMEATPARVQRLSSFVLDHFGLHTCDVSPESVPAVPSGEASAAPPAPAPSRSSSVSSLEPAAAPMEMPYVSMSRVNEVSACGYKYVLGHVWGVETDQPPVVKYGKALHHAAAILGEMFQAHAHETANERLDSAQLQTLRGMQSSLEQAARDLVARFPSMAARQSERHEAQLIATELHGAHGDFLSTPPAKLYSRLREVAASQWLLQPNDGGDARRLHSEMSAATIHMVHAFLHEVKHLAHKDSTLLSFPLGVELPISAELQQCLQGSAVEAGSDGQPLHLLGVIDRLDVVFPVQHDTQTDPHVCITDFKCAQQWRSPSVVPKHRPLPIAQTSRHQLNAYSKLVRCKLGLEDSQPVFARVASLERVLALGVQGEDLLGASRSRSRRLASQDQVVWQTKQDDTGVDAEIIQAVQNVQRGHLFPEPSMFKCSVCRFQSVCSHSQA